MEGKDESQGLSIVGRSVVGEDAMFHFWCDLLHWGCRGEEGDEMCQRRAILCRGIKLSFSQFSKVKEDEKKLEQDKHMYD